MFRHGWSRLRRCWDDETSGELRGAWQTLLRGLFVLWATLFFSLLALGRDWGEPVGHAVADMMRLSGKQGIYGVFLILGFLLAGFQTRRSQDRSIHVFVPLCFTVLLALYMLGQRYYGWDWVHGFNEQIGSHRYAYGVYRASGFMGHPLTLAYNAMLFGLMSLGQGLWLFSGERRRDAWLWLGLSGLLMLVILLSGSRFPLILTLLLSGATLLIWLWRRLSWSMRFLLPLGTILAGSILIVLEPQLRGRFLEFFSEQQHWEQKFDRLVFWKVHLHMALDHLWLGTGLYRYDQVLLDYYNQAGYTQMERKYAAHNIFLQTFADLGLLGLSGVLVFLVGLLGFAHRLWRRWQHPASWLLVATVITSGLLQNNLRDSEFLFALWVCIGLLTAWILEAGAQREPAESTTKRRADFENHQSGEDRSDRCENVRRSDAGLDPHQG